MSEKSERKKGGKAGKGTKPIAVQACPAEFADVERYHLKPGLFQLSQGGRKSTERLDIHYAIPDGGSVRITGPYPLRPFDARLLCAIICKAGQRKILLPADVEEPTGARLRGALELLDDAREADCLAIKTNMRELMRGMGYTWHGAKSAKDIEDSLDRMFDISIRIWKGTKRYRSHLLSTMAIDDRDSTMAIAIDPMLAESLLGGGHFARIDMDILRRLKSGESLLFIMLSNAIDPGTWRRFSPEELRLLLYGPIPGKMAPSTFSQQKSRSVALARKLVNGLEGWIMEEKNGSVFIFRPRNAPRLAAEAMAIIDEGGLKALEGSL